MYSKISIFLVILVTGCATEITNDTCVTDILEGTCIKVILCPYVLKLISNKDLGTVTKLKCGFEGSHPKVCCPKGEVPIIYNLKEETATNRPKPILSLRQQEKIVTTSVAPNIMEQRNRIFPNKTVCGKYGGISSRIFGGTITQLDEHPWLARMQYKIDNKDVFLCSAALITDRYLLTAAHCVQQNKPISVRLGEWNIETDKDCYNNICNDHTIDVNVTTVIKYPTSSPLKSADGDIALLRLEEAVTFTDYIQPICLPTSEYSAMQDYSSDSVYYTAGWGLTEFESESVVKREVQLKAVPIEICRNIYNINDDALNNIICAGGNKGKDTCKGDSGGPLVQLVSENYEVNWYVYGITSVGQRTCGSEGIPGMYTRVSRYMNWIREIVSQ